MSSEEENSIDHMRASELYPKPANIKYDRTIPISFPLLSGEHILALGKTSNGSIALTNFRLFLRFERSFVNAPLGLIESVESRDIFHLNIYCKDARSFRCTFANNDQCQDWFRQINLALTPKKEDGIFAFRFYAWCQDLQPGDQELQSCYILGQNKAKWRYTFGKEVGRMKFDLKKLWRICYINEDYKICSSYPKLHIVPSSTKDEDLVSLAGFRSSARFPSIVWRNQRTGAVIARCSQPEVGWLGWRNSQDEQLLQAINAATMIDVARKLDSTPKEESTDNCLANGSTSKKMLIIDARSYSAAFANRAKGGGLECPEYYPDCEILFMNLANIHSIRKSFQALRAMCAAPPEQINWLQSLDTTKWLNHICGLLRATVTVVNAVENERRPVLVHCSDGWDRTPQITGLAQLLMDPFYRSIEGFQVLVEKEWLDFGHKFADRCGNGECTDDLNERCPVFLQWLDCVYQLLHQFPCAFQFNEAFLVKLVEHTYSCLFGTFLCNNAKEREVLNVREKTSSVWTLIQEDRNKFRNYLYNPDTEVLIPSCQVRNLCLWTNVYLSSSALTSHIDDIITDHEPPVANGSVLSEADQSAPLTKTRSCDDIIAAIDTHPVEHQRRLSDPNIIKDTTHDSVHLVNGAQEGKINQENEESNKVTLVQDVNTSSQTNITMNGENEITHNAMDKADDVCLPEPESCCMNLERQESEVATNIVNGVMNSVMSKSDTLYNKTSESDSEKDYGIAPSGSVTSMCSSTDTLVNGSKNTCRKLCDMAQEKLALSGDIVLQAKLVLDRDIKAYKSKSCNHLCDTSQLYNGNGHQEYLNVNQSLTGNKLNTSTSTSDISDSHVETTLSCQAALDQTLLTLHLKMNGNMSNGLDKSKKNSSSNSATESEMSTPFKSQTPNSTCPTTPGADGKTYMNDPFLQRSLSYVSRHLDSDGLTTFVDVAQQQQMSVELQYRQRIEMLERQLQRAKVALIQYASGRNGHNNRDNGADLWDSNSLPDSNGSIGPSSLGSNATSEGSSWEQVDEKDADMTLWVPDHAVTHCAGCDHEFWIVRRRHHCRNCGKVFCAECANKFAPIPEQQLRDPVRVCKHCYQSLAPFKSHPNGIMNHPNGGMGLETRCDHHELLLEAAAAGSH